MELTEQVLTSGRRWPDDHFMTSRRTTATARYARLLTAWNAPDADVDAADAEALEDARRAVEVERLEAGADRARMIRR